MLAILISIRPKWTEKILSGEKPIEVRKTGIPRSLLPIKCFIYETKQVWTGEDGVRRKGRGMVVGEFICNDIRQIRPDVHYTQDRFSLEKETRLTPQELYRYAAGRDVYGWHATNVNAYDKPLPLSAFKGWHHEGMQASLLTLDRPPQSWRYIEL